MKRVIKNFPIALVLVGLGCGGDKADKRTDAAQNDQEVSFMADHEDNFGGDGVPESLEQVAGEPTCDMTCEELPGPGFFYYNWVQWHQGQCETGFKCKHPVDQNGNAKPCNKQLAMQDRVDRTEKSTCEPIN